MIENNLFSAPEKFIRRTDESENPAGQYRSEFERDRDRILYTKAFRRLSGKTQVFLPSSDDHIRTRLTHTVEVAQLAKIVGKNLGLDCDLIEAIALGHDLGHAPFGHVGERTLNLIMNNCDNLAGFQNATTDEDMGFKHNLQSVRITTKLAKIYGRDGLNLTNFTNWGIMNHSKLKWKDCEYYKQTKKDPDKCYLKRNSKLCPKSGSLRVDFYQNDDQIQELLGESLDWTFEGIVVGACDEIAQRHHDIEDGLISKIVDKNDLFKILRQLFDESGKDFKKRYEPSLLYYEKNIKKLKIDDTNTIISFYSKLIIDLYCSTLISEARNHLEEFRAQKGLKKHEDFVVLYKNLLYQDIKGLIVFPDEFTDFDDRLHQYLKERILNSHLAQQMDGKGRFIIRNIFKAYVTNPRQMHDTTIQSTYRIYEESEKVLKRAKKRDIGVLRGDIDNINRKSDSRFQIALLRAICDNIAGMTDSFAINEYKRLYG